jgi:hypothetical protein
MLPRVLKLHDVKTDEEGAVVIQLVCDDLDEYAALLAKPPKVVVYTTETAVLERDLAEGEVDYSRYILKGVLERAEQP